jgi:hypothetical protein
MRRKTGKMTLAAENQSRGKEMKKHKIRVKVEIVECENDPESIGDLEQVGDGEFALLISPEQACSIDDCEAAVLRTNYPALRDALTKHLATVSKKR